MLQSNDVSNPWLAQFQQHLQDDCYSESVRKRYPQATRCFIRYLISQRKSLESVSAEEVEHYLYSLKRRRDQTPLVAARRREHAAAVRMLLRLVRDGQWPPPPAPPTGHEKFVAEIVGDFDIWMVQVRGLSASTRTALRSEAQSLMQWLHDHGKTIATLRVAEIDAYVAYRVATMRRRSTRGLRTTLRGVLRYWHDSGRLPADLTYAVEAGPIYALEDIPSTIRQEDIARMLEAARRDRSSMGRRDYAILMLLATYGLRRGEVAGLRLSDIDWRRERLHIRHVKTGGSSDLPLMRRTADALLDYLKHGRTTTTARQVFLRAKAPYRPLTSAAIYHVVGRRLRAVDLYLPGMHGAHILRHSRAASMLRGGVPIKVIGDVLGHRSQDSTAVYLKLATDDLRAIALNLPGRLL